MSLIVTTFAVNGSSAEDDDVVHWTSGGPGWYFEESLRM